MQDEVTTAPETFIDKKIQLPAGQHKVWLAIVANLFIAGLGQIYNRQYLKGVFMFAIFVMLVRAFGLVGMLFIAAYSIMDARKFADKLYRGEAIGKTQF